MRLSLKAKLTALISILVLLVVLATSTLYLSSLTRQALREVDSKGQYVADELYHQARTVLAQSRMPAGNDPSDFAQLRNFVQSKLASDAGLASQIESAVGYSPTIYYVAITDAERRVLVHNDPGEIGRPFEPARPFGELVRAGVVRQLRVIYGPPQVYEILKPLDLGGRPLGDVRVGVSMIFLRNQITPDLRAALTLSGLAILFATVSAGLLSFGLLRPLEIISRGVDRLARGEYAEPVELDRGDEWGTLSSKLNLLGEQMRGEKAAYVQLKENLQQLFSKLAEGLMLFDRQDRLVLATPSVSRFLERSPEALTHRPAAEVFSGGSPLDQLLVGAFRSRESLDWQVVESAGNGQPHRVAASVQFFEAEGERVASLVTLRDASIRAELEDQLDITTKLATLGRLYGGVAHEVKNPLNAMVLQLEILKTKLGEQGAGVKPHLQILSEEIRHLDRVVKTFLDFSRPVKLHPSDISIEVLVREVFALAEPQARQNDVRLVFESDGDLPLLRVDRDLMKQALLNLILNGCQAMPSGGELRVRPRATSQRAELEIADQGVGIPAEVRDKIYSLFYTTKPGGSGIGLAMAFRTIQLHGGSINYTSAVNRGTTFLITLPRQF